MESNEFDNVTLLPTLDMTTTNMIYEYIDNASHPFEIVTDINFGITTEESIEIDYACANLITMSNCTPKEYLAFHMGPQTLPLYQAVLVTLIFGGIFITGVLGNVLVCAVICRRSAMRTATNYYLFSLAVSDLLYLSFGLPAEVYLYWHQYPYRFGLTVCKLRAFISEACTYVSVFTIVAFSMERFLAICHPLHPYSMVGLKRALRIIAVLWILSFSSAIPFGLYSKIEYLTYPLDGSRLVDSAFCSMTTGLIVFEISFWLFFVIPMALIIFLYGRMCAQVRSRTAHKLGVQEGTIIKESRRSQKKKNAVIRMLAAVVVTFFVCWFPFHLQRLWYLHAKENDNFLDVNEWLFSIAGFAYYVSCTINPIVYNVMSRRYRQAFKEILCRRRVVRYNNGYQSSFRESTIPLQRVQSVVHIRSSRPLNSTTEIYSMNSNRFSFKMTSKNGNHPALNTNQDSSVVLNNNSNGGPTGSSRDDETFV